MANTTPCQCPTRPRADRPGWRSRPRPSGLATPAMCGGRVNPAPGRPPLGAAEAWPRFCSASSRPRRPVRPRWGCTVGRNFEGTRWPAPGAARAAVQASGGHGQGRVEDRGGRRRLVDHVELVTTGSSPPEGVCWPSPLRTATRTGQQRGPAGFPHPTQVPPARQWLDQATATPYPSSIDDAPPPLARPAQQGEILQRSVRSHGHDGQTRPMALRPQSDHRSARSSPAAGRPARTASSRGTRDGLSCLS